MSFVLLPHIATADGTTHYHSYWWFAEILTLKSAVSVLFSFGRATDFPWHVWMHLVLAFHLALLVLRRPYRNDVDSRVELLAVLCLAMVTHIAGRYDTGEEFRPDDITLAVVTATMPLIAFVGLSVHAKAKAKKAQAKAKGAKPSEGAGDARGLMIAEPDSQKTKKCCTWRQKRNQTHPMIPATIIPADVVSPKISPSPM